MKKIHLILLLVLFPFAFVKAQEEATTTSGKKVILYNDGTWKYTTEESKKPVVEKASRKNETVKKEKTAIPELSSDCEPLFETREETRIGLRLTRSRNIIFVADSVSRKEIGIIIQKNSKAIISIIFKPVGAGGCIAEGNKVNIVFTDDSKQDFTNEAPDNCNGESVVNFLGNYGKKKQLEELKTKKIKSIKVWTIQGFVKLDISPENQQDFYELTRCVSNL